MELELVTLDPILRSLPPQHLQQTCWKWRILSIYYQSRLGCGLQECT